MSELSITFSAIWSHVRFFASYPLANNCLNLGIIGRYHLTFVERPLFVVPSSLHSSSFALYHDTPHVGHLCILANWFLYNMQSLGNACIFWYSIPTRHKIFFKTIGHLVVLDHAIISILWAMEVQHYFLQAHNSVWIIIGSN